MKDMSIHDGPGGLSVRKAKISCGITSFVYFFLMIFLLFTFSFISEEKENFLLFLPGLIMLFVLLVIYFHYRALAKKCFAGKDHWKRFYMMTFFPPKGVSSWRYVGIPGLLGGILGFLVIVLMYMNRIYFLGLIGSGIGLIALTKGICGSRIDCEEKLP